MFGLFGPSNDKIEQLAKLIHDKIHEISFHLDDTDDEGLFSYLKDDYGISLSNPDWIYPDLHEIVFHITKSPIGDGRALIVEGKMKYFGFNVYSVGNGKYSVTAGKKIAGPAMPTAKKLKNVLAKYDNFFEVP